MKGLLYLSISGVLIIGFGSAIAEAIDTKRTISPVNYGPKHIIDSEGGQASGSAVQLDSDNRLHLVWYEEQKDERNVLYLSTDLTSKNFPDPNRINSSVQQAASLHEPPALALGLNKEVYITWTTPHPNANGKPFTSLLLLSRSLDGGRAFVPPIQVNDDDAVTGHSFDHLAVSPTGSVHISWLDSREEKKDPATYTARFLREKNTVTANLKLDDHSCVCCRTHVTTADDGTVYIAWRKVFSGNIRETVVARSKDHGQTFSSPVIVGHDNWVLEGCPHRPATMGVDQNGRLYITWYTEGPDDTPGVYLAYSDDQGATFTPRRQLNVSKGTFPDHPQLAVNQKGHLLVTWEEQSPVRREVVFSYSLDRGHTFSSPQKLNSNKAKNPAIALNSHGQAVLVWQEQINFPGWNTVVQTIALPTSKPPLLSSQIR